MKASKFKIIIILLLLAFNMPAQGILELLPSPVELPGWKINQESKVYIGDNLFELINGGADIYLEYGFSQVVNTQYTDPSLNNIQVEIYEMTDASSAYGIFSITQQMAEWSSEYGNLSSANNDYIAFWKGNYYVNLSWSSRQHIEKPLLAQIAGLIAAKISFPGDYPELLLSFRGSDPGLKVLYLEGNLGLSNFYYFDYKDIFEIEQGVAWSKAGYHQIILRYPDMAKALEIVTASKQSISNNKRFTDVTNTYQGFSCTDNKGNRIITRQVNNFIVILIGLNPDISLVPMMDEVSHNIESLSR